jgi:ElaB/YqjD/DUF883 family membrane-anchored ribosome-binding protein
MPNNKNQNQNSGAAQGAREQLQNVGQKFQEQAEQVGNRLHEGYDTAREGAMYGFRQAEGLVARNPAPSILIGLGVGFGLGLVLSSMLTSREETWAEKYLPESLQDAPDRYHRLVESLRSLPRTVHDHLPHAVAKHLG